MGIPDILNDKRFNLFFSFALGIGLVCVFRPICQGSDCNINKPPADRDFDKYVYRMGGGKCYEFKSEIVECPPSGTIEGFRECSSELNHSVQDIFSRRISPIKRCE
jgi:hypothetical protein